MYLVLVFIQFIFIGPTLKSEHLFNVVECFGT